jgi:hypothetical protein
VLRAGEKLGIVVAVVAGFQGDAALQAHANGQLRVTRA